MRWCVPLAFLLAGCPAEEEGDVPCGSAGGGYVADYATSSDFMTYMAGEVDGGSIHGTVQIWYSTDLEPLIDSGEDFTAPVGATSIKTVRGTELAIMVKEEAGFDPDNGDWCYEFRSIDGTLQSAGTNSFCSDCHNAFTGTDRLGGTELE